MSFVLLFLAAAIFPAIPLALEIEGGNFIRYPVTALTGGSVFGKHSRRQESVSALGQRSGTIYTINLVLGTPGQSVPVQFDTGASELWVNPTCSQATDVAFCSTQPRFTFSTTLVDYGVQGSIIITRGPAGDGTGYVDFEYVGDYVGIGSARITQQIFGAAYDSSHAGVGILGAGPDLSGWTSPYPFVIDSLRDQGIINSRAFSMDLQGLESADGSVIFGGIDTKKYSGSLIKLPIVPAAQSPSGYTGFYVRLDGITVNQPDGTVVNVYQKPEGGLGQAYSVDSGYTINSLPSGVFSSLVAAFPSAQAQSSGLYSVDCLDPGQGGSVDFTFGDKVISVPYNDFVWRDPQSGLCILGAFEDDSMPVLGGTFLRAAYAVFDWDNQNIHLAQSSDCGSDVVAVGTGPDAVPSIVGGCAVVLPTSTTSSTTVSSTSTTDSSTSTTESSTSTTDSSTSTTDSSTSTTESSTSTTDSSTSTTESSTSTTDSSTSTTDSSTSTTDSSTSTTESSTSTTDSSTSTTESSTSTTESSTSTTDSSTSTTESSTSTTDSSTSTTESSTVTSDVSDSTTEQPSTTTDTSTSTVEPPTTTEVSTMSDSSSSSSVTSTIDSSSSSSTDFSTATETTVASTSSSTEQSTITSITESSSSSSRESTTLTSTSSSSVDSSTTSSSIESSVTTSNSVSSTVGPTYASSSTSAVSSGSDPTSTITFTTTSVYTVTSCAPEKTACRPGVVTTATITSVTTFCPEASSTVLPTISKVTATDTRTTTYTITSCAPDKTACHPGQVVTDIVTALTTFCPQATLTYTLHNVPVTVVPFVGSTPVAVPGCTPGAPGPTAVRSSSAETTAVAKSSSGGSATVVTASASRTAAVANTAATGAQWTTTSARNATAVSTAKVTPSVVVAGAGRRSVMPVIGVLVIAAGLAAVSL